MALLDVNFYSEKLKREVMYKAIIPIQKKVEQKPLKTLYLLHGITGNCTDWVCRSHILQLAEKYHMAVIMPSGANSFYVDQKDGLNNYGEYIGMELVEETRKLFPISHKREDTFIAGLSMGGYGAIRNGLKYHHTFGVIAGLSSAIIMNEILNSTYDAEWEFRRRSYYEAVFGDLSTLKGSDKDLEALVKMINDDIPGIYLACGTEDPLLENNRKYHHFLMKENIKHTYIESPGEHDWKFWDETIGKVMKWLMNQ